MPSHAMHQKLSKAKNNYECCTQLYDEIPVEYFKDIVFIIEIAIVIKGLQFTLHFLKILPFLSRISQ